MPPWITPAMVALAIAAPGSALAQGVSATIAPLRDSVGDGGPATAAFLDHPASLALDRQGNLYVAERNGHRVRRVDARSGTITSVAGTGVAGSSGDGGPATAAQVNYPRVAVHPGGDVYIAEVDGHRIRRIDARTGVITTIAGTGDSDFIGDGGPATAARITRPFGLAFDRDGNLYFTDTEVNRVRRIDGKSGVITTVAGDGTYGYGGDGGPATAAKLARPHVLAVDHEGNLLIGDSFNQRIRRVDRRTGSITTVAGSGFRGAGGDGGPALEASFINFGGLAVDAKGNLFVSGVGDHRIRVVDAATGIIRHFAGTGRWESSGDGGPARAASFHPALELAMDEAENLFVADPYGGRVRRVDPRSGVVTTVAGNRAPSPRPNDFHWHYDEAETRQAFDRPVAVRKPGMDQVRVLRDRWYTKPDAAAPGDRQRLDVYLPPAGSTRARYPVVLLVHGSEGNDHRTPPKDWGAWSSRGRLLAASGFVAVTFTHRLNRERGLVEAAEDLALALEHIRTHADSLSADAGRIGVVAFSDATPLLTGLIREAPGHVRALAAFSPHLDLRGGPPPFWMEDDSLTRARYSPLVELERGRASRPLLLLVGTKDDAELVETVRRAETNAAAVEIVQHPDGGHDFDRDAPGAATERALATWLDFLGRHLR